jgi:hypothetical protein
MPSSPFYMHIAERLFGEWSEFLTSHALSLEEEAAARLQRFAENHGSPLAGLPGPDIHADIIPHGVGDGFSETGAVERQVAPGKDAPAVAVP